MKALLNPKTNPYAHPARSTRAKPSTSPTNNFIEPFLNTLEKSEGKPAGGRANLFPGFRKLDNY